MFHNDELYSIRFRLLLSFLLGVVLYANGNDTKTYQIAFDINNFEISVRDSLIQVSSNDMQMRNYSEKFTLPVMDIVIGVPCSLDIRQVRTIPTDSVFVAQGDLTEDRLVEYATDTTTKESKEFDKHNSNVKKDTEIDCQQVYLTNISTFPEIMLLHLTLSPFKYLSENKTLYFTPELNFAIDYNESECQYEDNVLTSVMKSLFRDLVYNKEECESLLAEPLAIGLDEDYNFNFDYDDEISSPIDYVIITSGFLANSFQPLIDWKRVKGLRCKIVLVEDIESDYVGNTLKEKIKDCIYYLTQEHGVSCVLLGGGSDIIPAVAVYGKAETGNYLDINTLEYRIDPTLPSDLYYSCYTKNFEWDNNKNGILGEIDDDISMIPNVILTRLPLSIPNDIRAFVNKLISYEKNPTVYQKMLSIGTKLGTYINGKSDSHIAGERLYEEYVSPYWNGTFTGLYDTGNTWEINASSIKSFLEKGYGFVSVSSHGFDNRWSLGDSKFFTTSDVGNIYTQKLGTIITTTACHTNAFDKGSYGNYCLSQMFLAKYNSGVVAYLGCSREGWHYRDNYKGASWDYDNAFYKYLFSNPQENKSFGRIVTLAKMSMLGECYNRFGNITHSTHKWIQLGLNPMGDPEMPIYVDVPKEFTGVKISKNSLCYMIIPGVDDCTICVTGINNGKKVQKIYRNCSMCTISHGQFPANPVICITKQNYKPWIAEGMTNILSQVTDENLITGKIQECSLSQPSRMLTVKTDVDTRSIDSNLVISSVTGDSKHVFPIEDNGSAIIDLNYANVGVYVVTLLIDGNAVDSESIIVK